VPARLHAYRLTADIYGAWVDVFTSRENMAKWFTARGETWEPNKGIQGNAVRYTDPAGVKWFLSYLPPDATVENLAHECLHLAWDILDARGVKVTADNDEPLAYLMAHLLRQVLAHRRRKGKR
jgi:hypothetical protein